MKEVGRRVRSLRLEKNLSVRELAERADVSVSYVYAVEAGMRGTNLTKLAQIAKALGASVTRLVEAGFEASDS